MDNNFDELAKDLARSSTRRGALKKFCPCVTGIVLASFGLAKKCRGGSVFADRDYR